MALGCLPLQLVDGSQGSHQRMGVVEVTKERIGVNKYCLKKENENAFPEAGTAGSKVLR